MAPVVTFDLFSALLDSRSGGSAALSRLGGERGWAASGEEVYDVWDALNKAAQGDCRVWVPYAQLARDALTRTYDRLGLVGDPAADVEVLLRSMAAWSPWPDVAPGLPQVAARFPVGVLSNVDDELFERTQVAALVRRDLVLTSERLGVYKPAPAIYERAREACGGDLVHVATSARDVRGALEAGARVVRLRRPGHHLDPDGPVPTWEVDTVPELGELLGDAVLRPQG
jgi:2-haloalkanoic acid dehalogenase type II